MSHEDNMDPSPRHRKLKEVQVTPLTTCLLLYNNTWSLEQHPTGHKYFVFLELINVWHGFIQKYNLIPRKQHIDPSFPLTDSSSKIDTYELIYKTETDLENKLVITKEDRCGTRDKLGVSVQLLSHV